MLLENKKRFVCYNSLHNVISESAISTDESFMVLSWNKASERIFGFTEDEAIGNYLFSLVDFSIVNGSVAQVLESILVAGRWTGKAIVKYPGRKAVNIEVSINPINDEEGVLVGYVTVAKDITETVAAKDSLTALQKLFSSFIDHSPALSWIIDEDGYCHYLNDLYLKTFHLSTDAIGKHASQLFPEEIASEFLKNNAIVFSTGQPVEFIETAVAPDGKKIKYKVLKFPLDLPGRKKYMGGVAIDITNELEKQEQLKLSNERFHLVNKATSDHIWDWNIDKDRIVSGGFEWDEDECVAWHTLDESLSQVNAKDRERVRESLQKAIADTSRLYWEEEYSALDENGNYKTVIDKGYIIRNASGKATRMIGAQHDITELVTLQHQLMEQEKTKQQEMVKAVMDAQEKERQEIAYELHDNVNQLLTTCKLQLEAAETYANDKMYLSRISSYIQAVINEIRSISHQLTPANLETIGVIPTIEDMVSRINTAGKLKVDFHHKKIAITQRFNEDIELVIFRIVQEQLQNIIKHAAATHVKIGLKKDKDLLHLSIEDNGRGFDLNGTKKGLGLTNITSRTEYLGGQVDIKTGVGKGCKIEVTLPI